MGLPLGQTLLQEVNVDSNTLFLSPSMKKLEPDFSLWPSPLP